MSTVAYAPRLSERTPFDWRARLLYELDNQAVTAQLFEAYYDGQHPLQFATTKFREAFGTLFAAFADNWCQIVVDSSVERLKIVGFQVGGKPNTAAWEIWQESSLDVESVIAHTESGKTGHAFLLVDPTTDPPRITVESAAQVVVWRDPADRRKRLAALKRWLGDDGFVYATLYLPDVVLKYESAKPINEQSFVGSGVEWVERLEEDPEVPNELGVVPVIPLESKPDLKGTAHSDLEPAVPLQNAVNKLCTDLIVASEYGAFQQRVATGVEVPVDPETNQPLRAVEMKAAMSRLWTFKAPDAKVTSLPSTDLSNFVSAIEMFIQHLAAQTRTPPHYLLGQVVNASGDALSVAEAGLVSKCRGKILFFSDAWEEAIALALTAAGEASFTSAECEAIWANPERLSQAQLTDAAVKKKTLGVPLPMIWLELGYTPEQIVEMEKVETAAEEARLAAAAAAEAARVAVKEEGPQPGALPGTAPPSTGPAAPSTAAGSGVPPVTPPTRTGGTRG